MVNVIFITGTPGVGKTTLTNYFAEKGIQVFNLFTLATDFDCLLTYDTVREATVIDDDCLHTMLKTWLQSIDNNQIMILEGHIADVVPSQFVKLVLVLQPTIEILRPRLESRNYSSKKIQENIEAHIMQECYYDALEYYGKERVVKIDPEIDNPKFLISQLLEKDH